jgi:rhodanese-related sulfurtransferase
MTSQKNLPALALDLLLLASLSLTGGLIINQYRTNPLSLTYATPEQRLAEVFSRVKTLVLDNHADPQTESNVNTNAQTGAHPTELPTIDLIEMRDFVLLRKGLVVDARHPVDWQDGHMPGAVNLSRFNFEKEYLARRAELETYQNKTVVVYCSSTTCGFSKLIGLTLTRLGFRDVRVFALGWESWTANNYPIDRP